MRERLPLLIGLTLVAIAILLGAVAVGHGIRDRGKGDVVTVTGSAKQRITSDYAIWDLSVSSQQAQRRRRPLRSSRAGRLRSARS